MEDWLVAGVVVEYLAIFQSRTSGVLCWTLLADLVVTGYWGFSVPANLHVRNRIAGP